MLCLSNQRTRCELTLKPHSACLLSSSVDELNVEFGATRQHAGWASPR